jgi:hypothetical protein
MDSKLSARAVGPGLVQLIGQLRPSPWRSHGTGRVPVSP